MRTSLKKIVLLPFNILYRINPEFEQKLLFRVKMGYKFDLDNPQTYNEKLNWLKLKYRNDLMPICADKFLARSYIQQNGFEEYLPTLYWHGKDAKDIPFDSLPESFVIKSTSGSGNNIIVPDKSKLNRSKTIKTVNKWMKEKYLIGYGEWHYEKIEPSIIIEQYLSDNIHKVPIDYKLFCFNDIKDGKGKVGCVAVDKGRFIDHRRNIHDYDFNFLPEVSFGFARDYGSVDERPVSYDKMCEIASKLAEPFPHCRVVFFIIGERIYLGEITFFNGAGYDKVTPKEYNLKMGNWINLQ